MRQIDSKYKIDANGNLVKMDGTPIPDDEPLILFRAKDKLTPQLIENYKKLCQEADCPPQQVSSLDQLIQQFKDWQAANPDKVRIPDWD